MMKHGRWMAAAAVLVLGVGLVVATTRSGSAAKAAEAKPAGSARLLAKRVEICQAALKAVEDRERQGSVAISIDYARYKGNLFRRLADAELAVAADHAARVKAAEGYMERSKKFHGMVQERLRAGADVNDAQLREAEYTVNDAELLLEQVKGEK